MTQAQLNRAVARATGETVSQVERLGFNLVEVPGRPRHCRPRYRFRKYGRRRRHGRGVQVRTCA